jgi:AmmeMemoRadiSam system protein A
MTIVEAQSGEWSAGLSASERETLFSIARDTLDWCTAGTRGPFDFSDYDVTSALDIPRATFVTLHHHGMLRGCIGSLEPQAALYMSVHENAVGAALRDPRFPPVSPRECASLTLDVSILSPIEPIANLDAFHLGEHGIILEKGWNRAVYLPEVAVEQGWTVEQMLRSLSEKAGLPPDAWRQDTRFKVFSSVVLSVRE